MLVVGLMSGTSLDGMDGALVSWDGHGPRHADFTGVCVKYSAEQRRILARAVQDALHWKFTGPPPPSFVPAAKLLADIGAMVVLQVCAKSNLDPADLFAVGFHGQTVLHVPPTGGQLGQTLQIGDAPRLANAVQCQVVHDFRSADMAAGGHGAPLAPAWHFELAVQRKTAPFAFINIGGVSNITFVPDITGVGARKNMIAFDCGPGNGPLDAWISAHGLGQMDQDGLHAAKGMVHHDIVANVMDTMPKMGQAASLDRWAFDHQCVSGLSVDDGAASLVEITAQSILRAVQALPLRPTEIVIGGGGRHNPVLMQKLTKTYDHILSSEAAGFDGDLIEAAAFAWLAILRLQNKQSSWPGTTGVQKPMCLGLICAPCGGS